ncbi:hypothetical protein BGX34_004910, partial [Mortierella sp. NVP85]
MFKTQKPMAPSYHDDTSSVKSGNSFTRLFSSKKHGSNASVKSPTTPHPTYPTHHSRNASIVSGPISSPITSPITSPISSHFQGNRPNHDYTPKSAPLSSMATLSEELQNYQHYQQYTQQAPPPQELELQYPTPAVDDYRQCLHWLQQTCRPMFLKDLTQLVSVPVPITAANAKSPDKIGGTQDVQVANMKNVQVQVMPMERWGSPKEVLAE